MPRNVCAFFDKTCGNRPSFFFLEKKTKIQRSKRRRMARTVFRSDRIDDHVFYDEVRYVRFVARRRSSFRIERISPDLLPW